MAGLEPACGDRPREGAPSPEERGWGRGTCIPQPRNVVLKGTAAPARAGRRNSRGMAGGTTGRAQGASLQGRSLRTGVGRSLQKWCVTEPAAQNGKPPSGPGLYVCLSGERPKLVRSHPRCHWSLVSSQHQCVGLPFPRLPLGPRWPLGLQPSQGLEKEGGTVGCASIFCEGPFREPLLGREDTHCLHGLGQT